MPEERKEPIAQELNHILSWIEELNTVDTQGVEPLASVTGHKLPMRVDEVSDGDIAEQVLANAPKKQAVFLLCQRLLNNE